MRDEDKPFVLYRRSRFNFTIVPRGARGWRFMLGWLALLLPLIAGFVVFAETRPDSPLFPVVVAGFVLGMAAWTIGGILWMRARAEVIELAEVLRIKREQERSKRRR